MRKPAVDVDAELANLRSADWKVRSTAAQTLGKSRDAAAVEPLMRALSTDTSFTVRSRAAVSLGKLKDTRATEPLIGALHAGNWQLVKHASAALLKLGPQTIPVLGLYAQDQTKPEHLRLQCLQILGTIGTEAAADALLPLLRTPDFLVRLAAIQALGMTKSPQAFEPLLQELENPAPFSPPKTPPGMLAAVEYSLRPALQQALAEALSQFKDPRIVAPFVALLEDKEAFGPDTEMLLAITNGLRHLGGVEGKTFAELEAASRSAPPHTRLAAALSLSWLRDRRGLEPLDMLTGDENLEVRAAAIWSLSALETTLGYNIPALPLTIDYMLR